MVQEGMVTFLRRYSKGRALEHYEMLWNGDLFGRFHRWIDESNAVFWLCHAGPNRFQCISKHANADFDAAARFVCEKYRVNYSIYEIKDAQ